MAKYAIYSTNTGTTTARPVLGIIEIPDEPAATLASRLAGQPLNANEALIELLASAVWTDQDSTTLTNEFTVNTTLTPPVALTAVSVNRFSLQQRQAEYRRRRDELILFAIERANFGRPFTDGQFEDWSNYIRDLQNLSDEPANPEDVSFPTAPSESNGTDGVSTWIRLWKRGNTIGNVSKVSGVPAQQLVEYATTSNGYYWKFTDGILICTHRMLFTYNSAAQLLGTWTFPHAFGSAALDRRSVHCIMSTRNNSNTVDGITATEMAKLQPITNTQGLTGSVQILLRDPNNGRVAGQDCWCELFAMGRWDN